MIRLGETDLVGVTGIVAMVMAVSVAFTLARIFPLTFRRGILGLHFGVIERVNTASITDDLSYLETVLVIIFASFLS